MGLTGSEVHIIQIIATISGVLSILGSLSLILSFLLIKELRTFQSRLVLYLSIADLGEAIAWTLSTKSNEFYVCQVQGFFEEFFGVAPVLWQVCISVYLLQITMNKKNVEKQEIYYHLIAWGLPAVAIIFGGVYNIFGSSGAWCWVVHKHQLIGLGILYAPFLICFTFSVCVYTAIARIVKVNTQVNNLSLTREELLASYKIKRQLNTRLYLIPFGAGWLFGLTNRSYNLINPSSPQFFLFILHVIFFPLQGFWNFWMYGMTERLITPRSVDDVLGSTVCKEFFKRFMRDKNMLNELMCYLDVIKLRVHSPSLSSSSSPSSSPFSSPSSSPSSSPAPSPPGSPFYGATSRLSAGNVNSSSGGDYDSKATQIINKYFMPGSPLQITQSHLRVAKELTRPGSQVSRALFAKIQSQLQEILQKCFVEFKGSNYFQQMIEHLKVQQALTGQLEGSSLIYVIWRRFGFVRDKKRYTKIAVSL